jgi:hypothetical protein
MDKVIKIFFNGTSPNKIYSYDEFMGLSTDIINKSNPDELNEKEKFYYEYRKMNMQRITRIQKTIKPNHEIIDLVKNVKQKITLLIITEDWCGDSAQNLPYINGYVKFNPLINLAIILRDSNLEAIDNYFTEGNPRSIPKIVGFDEDGNELFIWGPRPKFAQDLVQQLKAEGYSNEEFNKELHFWYGRNRGKELEKELLVIFKEINHKEH